jgi:phosphoribosylaminoimidazole-succinocarboxamide synthase
LALPPEAYPIPDSVTDVTLAAYPLERRGKVRDIFAIGDHHLLIVATDRLSAFDVVLPSPIPGKGMILTTISDFWFDALGGVVPNHQSDLTLDDLHLTAGERRMLAGRSSLVKRADRIDIECVVRGHLAGSGWKEYEAHGTLAGEPLPAAIPRAGKLETPRFTPAIKNDTGHDETISRSALSERVGEHLSRLLEDVSLHLFTGATRIAARSGFIIADTKFEFGMIDGQITLIDEILTPDSSRFWDARTWAPGVEPASFDKQVVRDWLESSGWDKQAPGPVLPEPIIQEAADRYRAVRDRLLAARRSDAGQEDS